MSDASPRLPSADNRSMLERIFLTPQERRLRSGWRLLGQLILLTLCLVLFGTALGILMFLDPRLFNPNSLLLQQGLSFIALTTSVLLARRLLDRRSVASLGLAWNRAALKDLLAGFLISGLLMSLVFTVETAVGWLQIQSYAWQSQNAGQVILGTLGVFLVFIIVGWQEELVSRGYWLQNLSEGLSLSWGVLLSSALFALAHLGNPNFTWAAFLGLVSAGLFLAYGYVRTRALWLPIGLHIGWNFFEGGVFGFQVSGLDIFGLINHTTAGPALISGGKFGPEAGLIILPVLLLGTALQYFYTRRRA